MEKLQLIKTNQKITIDCCSRMMWKLQSNSEKKDWTMVRRFEIW